MSEISQNISQMSSEKDSQINTLSKIIQIIKDSFPQKSESPSKSSFRRRRKNFKHKQSNSELLAMENKEDVILHKRRPSASFKVGDQLTVRITDEKGRPKSEDGLSEADLSPIERILTYIERGIVRAFTQKEDSNHSGSRMRSNTSRLDKTLEDKKKDVLEVLDSIPNHLINQFKSNCVPVTQEVQTIQSFNKYNEPNTMLMTQPSRSRSKSISRSNLNINPLSKAIARLMNNKKEKITSMPDTNAFKLVETLLDDKINVDLENEQNGQKSKEMGRFILDQMSMKFGLKTLAVKNVISMRMGLDKKLKALRKNKDEGPQSVPYARFILQIMGIDDKTTQEVPQDHIDLIIKARAVFQEACDNYKRVMSIKPKKIQEKMKSTDDLNTGGE